MLKSANTGKQIMSLRRHSHHLSLGPVLGASFHTLSALYVLFSQHFLTCFLKILLIVFSKRCNIAETLMPFASASVELNH